MIRDYVDTVEWLVKHWISVGLIFLGVFGLLFSAAHQPTHPVVSYSFAPLWSFMGWVLFLYVLFLCVRGLVRLGPKVLFQFAMVPLYVFHFYKKHHQRMNHRRRSRA